MDWFSRNLSRRVRTRQRCVRPVAAGKAVVVPAHSLRGLRRDCSDPSLSALAPPIRRVSDGAPQRRCHLLALCVDSAGMVSTTIYASQAAFLHGPTIPLRAAPVTRSSSGLDQNRAWHAWRRWREPPFRWKRTGDDGGRRGGRSRPACGFCRGSGLAVCSRVPSAAVLLPCPTRVQAGRKGAACRRALPGQEYTKSLILLDKLSFTFGIEWWSRGESNP